MHLKAYAIDGVLLRTGSANLSPSGLKQQDNDLIILRDPEAVAKFEARFDEIYSAAEPMRRRPAPVAGDVPGPRQTPPVRSKATSTVTGSASITSPMTETMIALS